MGAAPSVSRRNNGLQPRERLQWDTYQSNELGSSEPSDGSWIGWKAAFGATACSERDACMLFLPIPSSDPRPPVDARLIEPETDAEMVHGVRVETMGSNEPHATQHIEVSLVFRGCLAPGYSAANDMLTRVDDDSDRAPDVSVFPSGRDPGTGGRRLEEIAFEVCDSESVAHVTDKALAFALRGVRRVFYVNVADRSVHEWQSAQRQWEALDPQSAIVDRCFSVPIPVAALVDRVLADDTVARALLAQRNRVLMEALGLQRKEGREEGKAEAVIAVLQARGLHVDDDSRARILSCTDPVTLARWTARAVTAPSASAVLSADA